jgi:hypothetical protein
MQNFRFAKRGKPNSHGSNLTEGNKISSNSVRLKCKILDCNLTEGALLCSSNANFLIAKTHKHVKANVLLCTSPALSAVFYLISRHANESQVR